MITPRATPVLLEQQELRVFATRALTAASRTPAPSRALNARRGGLVVVASATRTATLARSRMRRRRHARAASQDRTARLAKNA